MFNASAMFDITENRRVGSGWRNARGEKRKRLVEGRRAFQRLSGGLDRPTTGFVDFKEDRDSWRERNGLEETEKEGQGEIAKARYFEKLL